MIVTQQREPSDGGATLSKVYIDNLYICDLLEDQVREIDDMPVSYWKVHGETAIPHGTYQVTTEHSMRFGPDTLTLLDVPGFQYIRIHGGNNVNNTEGCLLPGTRNSKNTVAASQIALRALRSIIIPALDNNEEVWWEIKKALVQA